MKQTITLIKKDVRLLFLRPEVLWLQISLAVLLSVIAVLGMSSIIMPQDMKLSVFPVILWLIFIFSGSISLSKSLDLELETKAINNFRLFQVPLYKLFFSKLTINFLLSFSSLFLYSNIIAILMSINLVGHLLEFTIILFLVSFAYAAISTLLVPISASSKIQGLLLPLILLPLLFPLFFAAIELTAELLLNNNFTIFNFWFMLLCFLNILYVVLGINLYEYNFE